MSSPIRTGSDGSWRRRSTFFQSHLIASDYSTIESIFPIFTCYRYTVPACFYCISLFVHLSCWMRQIRANCFIQIQPYPVDDDPDVASPSETDAHFSSLQASCSKKEEVDEKKTFGGLTLMPRRNLILRRKWTLAHNAVHSCAIQNSLEAYDEQSKAIWTREGASLNIITHWSCSHFSGALCTVALLQLQ